jgi:hypothetical protein
VTPFSAAENQGGEMNFGDRRLYVDSSRPLRADIVEKAVKYFGDGCSREFDGAELILIAAQLCARRPNLSF